MQGIYKYIDGLAQKWCTGNSITDPLELLVYPFSDIVSLLISHMVIHVIAGSFTSLTQLTIFISKCLNQSE